MRIFLFRGFIVRIKETILLAEVEFEKFFKMTSEEKNNLLLIFKERVKE
ncbi:hypothetical protein KKA23_03335 [Patescibacteria group bacterium]|nr:hypothetical protein [Patescibacteria group bacterium]MBU3922625.1 hypothetical protein [Patescibacteria group bacterium]